MEFKKRRFRSESSGLLDAKCTSGVILLLLVDPLASMGVKLLLSSGVESEVTMMKLWQELTTTCIVFFTCGCMETTAFISSLGLV